MRSPFYSLSRARAVPGPGALAGAGRRRSRTLLFLSLLMGALLLAGGFGGWLLYLSVRGAMDRELEQRLLSLAGATAQALGTERMAQLLQEEPGSAGRQRLRSDLERLAEANDLDDITVVDTTTAIVVRLREDVPETGLDPVLTLSPELRITLVSGEPRATPLTEVEGLPGEYLKTGFAAVSDTAGNVLGAVAVEGGSDFFSVLPGMKRKVLVFAGVSLGAAAVILLLMLRLLRGFMQTEESLRSAATLAAIGQISAVVAHEIKNPLAIIRSRAERVQAKIRAGKSPEEVLTWFEAIPAEVDRLDHILSNYLSLARPDQDADQSCAAARACEETLRLLAPDLAKQGIALRFEEKASPVVNMGKRSLKQVLLNLVLNSQEAILEARRQRATPGQGPSDRGRPSDRGDPSDRGRPSDRVDRSAGGAPSEEGDGRTGENGPGRITLRLEQDRTWAVLTVEDDGIGMSAERKRRALEPFYTTRATGSGLGLTLVLSLVQARGGSLEIRSAPGAGAAVSLRLPEAPRTTIEDDKKIGERA